MLPIVDHLVYASPDLDAGIAFIEHLLGCEVAPGGRHEGWGTRNALVSLGPATYLEIIGPDPDSTTGEPPLLFGIDRLDRPRVVTWAAKGTDLAGAVGTARASGIDLGPVTPGSRTLPDGTVLEWQLTSPFADRFDGVVPFLIDWGDSPHPAAALPAACELIDLTLEHPDTRAGAALRAVGIPMDVAAAETATITAAIRTPTRTVALT